jgi:uncharacterized membrane protein
VPLVRILGLIAAIAVGFCVLMYVVTGQDKWRRIGWQIFSAAVFATVLVLLLFLFERLVAAA